MSQLFNFHTCTSSKCWVLRHRWSRTWLFPELWSKFRLHEPRNYLGTFTSEYKKEWATSLSLMLIILCIQTNKLMLHILTLESWLAGHNRKEDCIGSFVGGPNKRTDPISDKVSSTAHCKYHPWYIIFTCLLYTTHLILFSVTFVVESHACAYEISHCEFVFKCLW